MAGRSRPVVRFRRTVAPALEAALAAGGQLRFLVDRVISSEGRLDFQLRGSSGSACWASVYLGLTSVLDVYESGGNVSLRVHATHQAAGGFNDAWSAPTSVANLAAERQSVEGYLDRILADGAVDPRWTTREGRVQSMISSVASSAFGCFQREAVPAFESEAIKNAIVAPITDRIWDAISMRGDAPPWWPGVRDRGTRPRAGLEADLLGVDEKRRLVVIEVKPADEIKGIAWAPGQARLYAELFALVLEVDPGAADAIGEMIEQRRRLGLPSPPWELPDQPTIRVVPVVSIGAGHLSPQALPRLAEVHAALQCRPPISARLDAMEVWQHDEYGQRTAVWRPDVDKVPNI